MGSGWFGSMVTTRNDTVDGDDNAISLYIENGDHTLLPLTYAEGRAPTIDFVVNRLLTYIVLFGALLGVVVLATSASSRSISDARVSTLTTE